VSETQLMQHIKEDIAESDHRIYIESSKGQLLKILAKSIGAKKILEIGTLYGYSTLWLHQGLSEGGEIHTIEKDSKRFKKAQTYLKGFDNINVHLGDACEVLEAFQEPVDMVFIDADKNNYLTYLEWSIHYLRPGGLLVADDTLLFGAIEGKVGAPRVRQGTIEHMKAFNERIKHAPFESVMLPYEDGFTVALKVLSS